MIHALWPQNECLYERDIPAGVKYVHIKLVAKELPAQDFVDEVCAAAKAFWQEVNFCGNVVPAFLVALQSPLRTS